VQQSGEVSEAESEAGEKEEETLKDRRRKQRHNEAVRISYYRHRQKHLDYHKRYYWGIQNTESTNWSINENMGNET
jgi:hypothetical protein